MSALRELSVKTPLGRGLRKSLHFFRYNYFRLTGDERNFKTFESKQFYLKDAGKRDSYVNKTLYMDDEGAAVCYTFGVNYLKHSHYIKGAGFREEVDRILSLKERSPKLAVNIGCGLGVIDAALTYGGVRCVGIDPSQGAREGYAETFKRWLNTTDYMFVNQKAHEGIE